MSVESSFTDRKSGRSKVSNHERHERHEQIATLHLHPPTKLADRSNLPGQFMNCAREVGSEYLNS